MTPIVARLEMSGLTALANRRFGELSGGERQRVLFALAICGDPLLLLLDEPTVGFDVETRRQFYLSVDVLRHFRTGVRAAARRLVDDVHLSNRDDGRIRRDRFGAVRTRRLSRR
jgi:ABC-type nitrate/sulfonate/bicarbonate transport system ATPase subunit